jgi:hypothetical protein
MNVPLRQLELRGLILLAAAGLSFAIALRKAVDYARVSSSPWRVSNLRSGPFSVNGGLIRGLVISIGGGCELDDVLLAMRQIHSRSSGMPPHQI